MTTINIMLTDASDGQAAIAETTAEPPSIGAKLTPAQALAVDLLRTCKAQAREVRYLTPTGTHSALTVNPPKPLIIGLCGPAGAGKDTVAAILRAHAGFRALAFADALREEVCSAYGIEPLFLTRRELKDAPQAYLALNKCGDRAFITAVAQQHNTGKLSDFMREARSPRQIMQWWGTEYRRAQRDTYWLDQVAQSVQNINRALLQRAFVITDVRFHNEAQAVRNLAGQIWQVTRPGAEATGAHASDVSGAEFNPDNVIANTGSLHDLVDTVSAAYRVAEVHAAGRAQA